MTRTIAAFLAGAALTLTAVTASAAELNQPALDPAKILNQEAGSWPTYSGDYSGQRYSPLKQINQANVSRLTEAWSVTLKMDGSDANFTGGEAKTSPATGWRFQVRGSVLKVGDVLYASAQNNAWAIDARTGKQLWHYFWISKGGTAIGNRGPALWQDTLIFETPDNNLVGLDAKTGKERWHVPIASFEEQYFSTAAPVVIGDQVMVGTGNDLDMPGFLQSFDPRTGKLNWKFYTVPMNEGDPGLDTWKDLDAARHGAGNAWVPGSYDAETGLYIFGTGNPSPSYFAEARGNKDALFTCSLIAIDIKTGKMKWYYQTSPNDTHDWDSVQQPILADITIKGKKRKVAMQAARNGYFFVVDRLTGEHLGTTKYSDTANWAEPRLNAKGQPVRIPEKDHSVGGSLVSMGNQGASNWMPPSFDPVTGYFFVGVSESWAMYHTIETDPRGGAGLGGKEEFSVTNARYIKAIDPRTNKIVWSVSLPLIPGAAGTPNGNGMLTTAGRLLFAQDANGNLVARDPANGKPLWHAPTGDIANAAQTYMQDGKQVILVSTGDVLHAYTLP